MVGRHVVEVRVLDPKTPVIVVIALFAMVSLTGCPGIPNDDRYQNTFKGRGGGWENFRAEASIARSAT
jgi:hypothetical protein